MNWFSLILKGVSFFITGSFRGALELFDSFNAIFVFELELCMREEVIQRSPLGSPGWPWLVIGEGEEVFSAF